MPGHERFVRTMVAGATGIDLFLLVVAADDGVMPQTREHLAVLELLGVPAGVVALTKADLVGRRASASWRRAEVRELLAGGPYAEAAVVAGQRARRGPGLDELRAALERAAPALADRARRGGPARLHVDRCFTLQGIGTVVTGTLWSGELARGRGGPDRAAAAARARVRERRGARPSRVERAGAGQRVALNLAGVERGEVERGDVVVAGEAAPAPTYLRRCGACGCCPARGRCGAGTRVHVHHGTRETPARVAPLEGDALEPGARASCSCGSSGRSCPPPGDRFVLRQVAPPDTIGGGMVDRPARRESTGRGRRTSSGCARSRAATRWSALRLELEAARSGPRRDDAERELLEQLARAGDAVRAAARARALVRARRSSSARAPDCCARWRGEPRPRRRPRARWRAAPGLDAAGRAARCSRTLVAEGAVSDAAGGSLPPVRHAAPRTRSRARCSTLLREDGAGAARAGGARGRGRRRAARTRVRRSSGWRSRACSCGVQARRLLRPGALERARAPRSSRLCDARRLDHDRRAARRARHQPQVRPGAARALRRRAGHPPRAGTSTSCAEAAAPVVVYR